ncbi:MAG TPA: hypothetical protein VHI13_11735 [Candidatus Kapabacteria bacterium]|nr:hypothetical protein [Candidatus Kapabacteria bacterium]
MSALVCDLSHVSFREDQLIIAKFFSSTDTSREPSPAHIPDTADGYVTEMERLGQSTSTIGTAKLQYDVASGLPYPTRLRPVTDLSPLIGRATVRLVSVMFQAYDTVIAGGTGQDATTGATLTDTVTPGTSGYSSTGSYMQSRFRNSVVGGWQPNWFRPKLLIDGRAVFFRTIAVTSLGSHAGDLSIGLTLPWCWRGDCTIGRITKGIDVHAGAWQRVDNGGGNVKYLRFAIDCELAFIIEDKEEPGC